MSKQKTKLPVAQYINDQQGSHTFIWYYNMCGESRKIEQKADALNDDAAHIEEGFLPGVQSSHIEVVRYKLVKFVQDKNSVDFIALLQVNFIYPEKPFFSLQNLNYNPEKVNDFQYEIRYTRPNIEALFFDNNRYFAHLIDLLLETNDEALFQAFRIGLQNLQNTSIPENKLFAWDEHVKNQLLHQIDDLNKYGLQLQHIGGGSKGTSIIKTVSELREKIKNKKIFPPNEKINLLDQFNLLKFKLEITKKFHDQDETFSKHRGYKRMVFNLFSIVFTGGMANIIHKRATDVWWFFNKTRTEEKIDNIQATIVNSKERINFTS